VRIRFARDDRVEPVISIVVAASENADLVRQDLIDQPVFQVDAPRPAPGEFVFKRLRLAQAGE
jgi:hypothetical protein